MKQILYVLIGALATPVFSWVAGFWDWHTIERSFGLAYVIFSSIGLGCMGWSLSRDD